MVRGWEDIGRISSHGIHEPRGPGIWGRCRGSSRDLRKPWVPESQRLWEPLFPCVSQQPLWNRASESVSRDVGTPVLTQWFHPSSQEHQLWSAVASAFLEGLRRNPIASRENTAHRCPDSYGLAFPSTESTLWALLAPVACWDSSFPSSPQSAGVPRLGHQQSAGLGPRQRTGPGGSRCSGPLLRRPE